MASFPPGAGSATSLSTNPRPRHHSDDPRKALRHTTEAQCEHRPPDDAMSRGGLGEQRLHLPHGPSAIMSFTQSKRPCRSRPDRGVMFQ